MLVLDGINLDAWQQELPAGNVPGVYFAPHAEASPVMVLEGLSGGQLEALAPAPGATIPTRSDVRSPTRTSTEVRSPTSTSTEVRSPTSTSTEVRSPTSTSTDAYTAGNITVTGGAGAGATIVSIYGRAPGADDGSPPTRREHQEWFAQRLPPVQRATPDGYRAQDRSPPSDYVRATDYPDVSRSLVPRATDNPDVSRSLAMFADAATPIYKKPWFWAVAGLVGAAGIGFAVSRRR